MNTRLTATQTNRLPQPCVKGCSFVTTRESGMCKACELAGEKMREPIAKTDPMPEAWRHVGRERIALDVYAASCAPEPSAPVLREADAVACDSGEVSHMELKPWVVVCGIGAVLVTLAALCMLGR